MNMLCDMTSDLMSSVTFFYHLSRPGLSGTQYKFTVWQHFHKSCVAGITYFCDRITEYPIQIP